MKTSARSGMVFALAPLNSARILQIAPAMSSQKIAVVGAGIAGLVAAFELMQSGHDVTVFEARTRPGGRVYTMRDGFSDNLYAEGGAFDFGDAYTILLEYIKMFNLQFYEDSKPTAQDVYYFHNQRNVVPSGTEPNWPYQLTSEERKLGLQGLWDEYVLPAAAAVGKPLEGDWPNTAAREFDKVTINQFLRQKGASEAVISLLKFNFLGDDFDHVSALQDMGWSTFFARNRGGKRLQGGNDQLPKAFAARLAERLHYGAALQKLSQDSRKVRLSLLRAGTIEQIEVDHVILAIPFSTLRQVDLDNSFTVQKRKVISKLRYESITRVYLQSASRFWDRQGLAGYAATDLPVRTIGEFTLGQPGKRGILGTETVGMNAHVAAMMDTDERVRWCLENVSKVFPEMRGNYEGGTSVAWEKEPWSLGANAYFAPTEMTAMLPHVATPEGRVHFAGEHTSNYFVMEGAAQSGVRAAHEVAAAVSGR